MNRSLAILVGATASLGLAAAASARGTDADGTPASGSHLVRVYPAVANAIATTGWADVLVGLEPGVVSTAPLGTLQSDSKRVQDAVLASVGPQDFRLKIAYDYFPVMAGRISATGLAKLRANPSVRSVDEDLRVFPSGDVASLNRLAESVPSIGADDAHRLGIKGQGIGVAVVDTGIDNDHPDLADAIVDQVCFSADTRSCAPGGLPRSDNAEDEHGHGTAVSAIVLGRGKAAPVGVAPEAKLIGVRVFQDQGGAPTSDIVSGLSWIVGKQATHNIRVVNMSLGGGASAGVNCDDQYASVKQVFQSLVSRNVAIFVATGNGGNTDRVAFPACISNSTGVGSTWDADLTLAGPDCHGNRNVGPLDITCYTDRGPAMDLVAPGSIIVSARMGGGATSGGHGTSFASPHAAGVAALVFSALSSLRSRDIEHHLQVHGDVVIHPERGTEIMRVNASKAVRAVLPASPTPTATEVGTQIPPATPSSTPAGSDTPTSTPPAVTATETQVPPETPTGVPAIFLPISRKDRRP